jgi:GPH family glycoside/pentoside/hexuronide:cation symporter
MPFRLLLFYALPALPLAALTLPLYIIVPTYYTETLGLSLGAVGAALLAVRIFDAVNDPLIGWLADRWRPGMGRRRAVFALSLPVCGLAALMLFWPPADAGVVHLALWGMVLSLGFTGAMLSYTAWGAELAGDYAERARIAGFRESLTLAGTLVAIALPFAIGFGPAGGLGGLAVLGLSVVAGLAVFGALAVLKVPEPVDHTVATGSLREGLSRMAANAPFRRLIAAYFLNGLANGIPATLFLYFVATRLGAPDLRGPLLFLYFLAGIAGVPLALWTAQRTSKHRAWCVAMLANCAIFALVPLLGGGDVTAFAAICVATGLLLGFDLALPPAIQADVIDVDTAQSGEQRSGAYFAAWSLATKLALAAGVGIVFPLLGLAGFDAAAGEANDEAAIGALVALYVWPPVGLKLGAIALMWGFPLDRLEQASLRRTIEERSATARGPLRASESIENAKEYPPKTSRF